MKSWIKNTCFFMLILTCGCSSRKQTQTLDSNEMVHQVTEEKPPITGNPEQGFKYLFYGDYIASGIPISLLKNEKLRDIENLSQDSIKKLVGPTNNVFKAENGVGVTYANCFSCHGSYIDGKFQLGVGNTARNFSKNQSFRIKLLSITANQKTKKNSPEREAFDQAYRYLKAYAPEIVTEFRGPNPAFRLEEACVRYRNPEDLTYTNKSAFKIKGATPASDVPPLWNVRYKRSLYYNGMGRGSFDKMLMQASVAGLVDTVQARRILANFDDVVAWTASIQPPKWPQKIDPVQTERGEAVFNEKCSNCHGTYGKTVDYPNLIIPLSKIGTDPYYAQYMYTAELPKWYNRSWFAQSEPKSYMLPSLGYVAPPLVGIWATAPYLHNGSIPNLEALLNSNLRPAYWMKDPKKPQYDYEKVGWKYTVMQNGKSKDTYNTTLTGYGNQGHIYGDKLTDAERKAVIEYLKTL